MRYKIFFSTILVILAFAFTSIKGPLTIKGNVKDEKGAPIAGASIIEKGTTRAVQTDASGMYTIKVSRPNAVLLFSYIGHQTVEVKVDGKQIINAVLNAQTETLADVVVVSYQTVKKSDFVGGCISIRAYEPAYQPVSQVLQGRSAGVTATNSSNANILVRGISSVPNNNNGTPINQNNLTTVNISKQNNTNSMLRDSVDKDFNTEGYDKLVENRFLGTTENPLSTFSIDVDVASYSNIRRFLNSGSLPPQGSIRIEEMVNYFNYQYPQPKNDDPFSVNTEMSECPWNAKHKLVLIGLQGKQMETAALPASNLVFLIDVSGSMEDENKLPLVKASLKLLVNQLRQQDKVSLVVYAGNAGLVLPATSGANKQAINEAIDKLESGGSTAGGEGIQLAYKVAKDNFEQGGNNRVILCTDGDFNVGQSSDAALETLIEEERESGVFLTVLGYGMGNYQDSKIQKLADKGNGNHAYIDGISEAKKVLVNEFGGTLFTIAKDVKLQIEFNPAKVKGYRLIGYENRMLAKEDFNDDKKDAGELGSGHTVTALYEIIPFGTEATELANVDELRYEKNNKIKTNGFNKELLFVKLRYKKPDGNISKLIQASVKDKSSSTRSNNLAFASAVAEFGLLLINSKYKGSSNFESVKAIATASIGKDQLGYRAEFLQLVELASNLQKEVAIK
jgi:Ca-activated chloride channel family protein